MTIRNSARFIFMVVAIASGCWFAVRGTASADATAVSSLTIVPINDVRAGDSITISARLVSGADNQPVANALLVLHINGASFQQIRTDEGGNATVSVREPVSGTYRLDGYYAGSDSVLPSHATTNFNVEPAVLEIQTVPSIQGVEIEVGSQSYRSDSNGVIHVEEAVAGNFELHLVASSLELSGSRAVFSRWADDTFSPDRSISISSTVQLQVGFDTSDLVSFNYADPHGDPVDFSRISGIVATSSTGATLQFQTDDPQWVAATRVIRRQSGLESVPIQWGINSVTIDGSNVVNSGQQRFTPEANAQWNVETLLFSGVFTAHDALFGFQRGHQFEVTYPNGSNQILSGDSNGRLTLESLVRGTYLIKVIGAHGLATATPVDVSRDQTTNLVVLSYLDMAVGTGLALFVAAVLLLIGRPMVIRAFGIPSRFANRRIFVRAGVTVLALVATLLVTFDTRLHGDTVPVVPNVNAASANQSSLNGRLISIQSLDDLAVATASPTATPTSTPTPTPQASNSPGSVSQHESTVMQYSVNPVFSSFWVENGGLPVFGYPIGDAVTIDPQHGIIAQQFERQSLEYHPENAGTSYEFELSRIGFQYASDNGLLTTAAFQPVPHISTNMGSGCMYFHATEHTVCGAFLKYWQSHGLDFGDSGTSFRESLALFGNPISEPFVDPDTGLTIQYFERARFEFRPANPGSQAVTLGRLEVDQP